MQVSWLRQEIAKRLSVRSAEQIVLVSSGKAMFDAQSVAGIEGERTQAISLCLS